MEATSIQVPENDNTQSVESGSRESQSKRAMCALGRGLRLSTFFGLVNKVTVVAK